MTAMTPEEQARYDEFDNVWSEMVRAEWRAFRDIWGDDVDYYDVMNATDEQREEWLVTRAAERAVIDAGDQHQERR